MSKQILETKNIEKETEVRQQLNEVLEGISQFKKQLESNYPKYYQLKYANITATAQEIQKQLPVNTLFLEYFVADSMIYLFSLSKEALELYPLKGAKKDLSAKTESLRKALSDYEFIKNNPEEARESYINSAHWFYEQLLAPAPSI